MQIFWAIFAVLLVFGLVVCFHEFGHYIVAKLCGIGVEIFSFGMGPRAFGWKRGETDYRVSYLPLGGYVKLQGDDEPASDALVGADAPPAPSRDTARDFTIHPKWQRLAVMAAGATFNLILAFILFTGLQYGKQPVDLSRDMAPFIVNVEPGSPADKAGLKPLDVIRKIAGSEVLTAQEAAFQIVVSTKKPYTLSVDRGSQHLEVTVTPEIGKLEGEMYGKIGTTLPAETIVFGAPPAGSPAEQAGLHRLDVLQAINGTPIRLEKVKSSDDLPIFDKTLTAIALTVVRDQQMLTLNMNRKTGELWGLSLVEIRENGWGDALREGTADMAKTSTMLLQFIHKLFNGQSSAKGLSGPLGIMRMIGGTKFHDFGQYFHDLFKIAAFISLQLAVVNLLPIPALDGGHILILLLEGLFRRDFSRRAKERIIEFGFYGLLALIGVLVVMDVMKMIPAFR